MISKERLRGIISIMAIIIMIILAIIQYVCNLTTLYVVALWFLITILQARELLNKK